MNLIINRIKYNFTINENAKVYFSTEQIFPFSIKRKFIEKDFQGSEDLDNIILCLNKNNFDSDDYVFFDFNSINPQKELSCNTPKNYYKKYLISIFKKHFESQELLVDLDTKVADLAVYKYKNTHNDEWDEYENYEFTIKSKRNELVFNLVSNFTLVSKSPIPYDESYKAIKYIGKENSKLVRNFPKISEKLSYRFVANNIIKAKMGIDTPNDPINYTIRYKQLFSFFNKYLKSIQDNQLSIISNGLINTDLKDTFKVNLSKNKILFKNGKTDINPISGMRNYGVYKESDKALTNKFLFSVSFKAN